MFDFIEDAFDNVLDIVDDGFNMEVDSNKSTKLAKDGFTVYEIANLTNTSVSIVSAVLGEN